MLKLNIMETIASFQINHKKLKCGVFVSRMDSVGNDYVTTFDLRMKKPYRDEPMSVASMHTIEHLGATYMRNDALWSDKIVYFGPMGCRTGFYLIVKGWVTSETILPFIERTFDFISEYTDKIPGASEDECGNCYEHDLEAARYDAALYYNVLIEAKKENLYYPQARKKKS